MLKSAYNGVAGAPSLLKNNEFSEALLPQELPFMPISSKAATIAINFTKSELAAQVMLYAIATYMVTTTLVSLPTQALHQEKALSAALFLGLLTPWTMEGVKSLLNLIATPKKYFSISLAPALLQSMLLVTWAVIFSSCDLGKKLSPLLYKMSVTAPGILLKITYDFLGATYLSKPNDYSQLGKAHANKSYNFIAMHGMRLALLACGVIAGNELLVPYLAPMIAAFRLKNFSGIIGFSLLFNEILGGTLFWQSGWLESNDAYPNYLSRIITTACVSALFESALAYQEENLLNLFIDVIAAFIIDLAVQLTVGPKIDRFMEQAAAYLKEKCCMWQPMVKSTSLPMMTNLLHSTSN